MDVHIIPCGDRLTPWDTVGRGTHHLDTAIHHIVRVMAIQLQWWSLRVIVPTTQKEVREAAICVEPRKRSRELRQRTPTLEVEVGQIAMVMAG